MNARDELLYELKNKAAIKCAFIKECYYAIENPASFVLPVGHTLERLTLFMESLNFNYDNGYGAQFLDGVVWLEDGTWLDRGEYDGSEWWNYQVVPEIPDECKPITKKLGLKPRSLGRL